MTARGQKEGCICSRGAQAQDGDTPCRATAQACCRASALIPKAARKVHSVASSGHRYGARRRRRDCSRRSGPDS